MNKFKTFKDIANKEDTPMFDRYVRKVCERFEIGEPELFERWEDNRDYFRANARHTLYLLCDRYGMRIMEIKRFMKHSGHIVGHSTIIKGIRKANHLMRDDNDYKRIITTIEESTLNKNEV